MNVQEVISISNERKNKFKNVILKIVENIHKKIKYYAKNKKEGCTYIIPILIDDTPIYDRKGLTKEVYKILNEEGYIISAFENGQIDICWNEKLVQKKLETDRYILSKEEQRLNKHNKQNKILTDRFNFLANPNKVTTTLEEKLDQQVEKILKEKEKQQQKLSKSMGNFNKL